MYSLGWLVGFEAAWAPLNPMGKARKVGGPITPSREAPTKLFEYFFYITHALCTFGPHKLNLAQEMQSHCIQRLHLGTQPTLHHSSHPSLAPPLAMFVNGFKFMS